MTKISFKATSIFIFFLFISTGYLLNACAEGGAGKATCGNGVVEPGEECDGSDLGGKTCKELGYTENRNPLCTSECKLDTSVCACVSECTLGETKCEDNFVMMCVDSKGCASWTAYEDCAAKGLVCDESTSTATCKDSCSDACTPKGEKRCSDSNNVILQECAEQGNGCLGWKDVTNCASEDKICSDGQCVCPDTCNLSDTRCDGSLVQLCITGTNGCHEWETQQDCTPTGKVCSTADGEAKCVTTCSDACSPEGNTSCSGNVVRSCVKAASGCLEWQDSENCEVSGKLCNSGQCVCPDVCTPGDTRCNGNFVESCATGTNGCPEWQQGENCEATDRTCSSGQCTCVNDCNSEGEKRCSGDVVQNCTADAYQCLHWTDGQNCSASGQTCSGGECKGGSSGYTLTSLSPGGFSTVYASAVAASGSDDYEDDGTFLITLPFSFTFYGQSYTEVYACTNGWLSFGTDDGTATYKNGSLPDGKAPYEALYPYWDDLVMDVDDSTHLNAGIYYKTTGSAPNRVVTIEWHEIRRLADSSARLSFQVKLYEGSNIIEFLYDRDSWLIGGGNFSATIGIESDSGNSAMDLGSSFSSYPPNDYRFTP